MRSVYSKLNAALLGWLAVALMGFGLLLAGCQGDDIESVPEAAPGSVSGVHTELPVSLVLAGGWRLCHSETYATSTSDLATVLGNCSGQYLMMACRPTGAGVLTVAALAPTAEVTFVTPADTSTTHPANGVSWYYNPGQSWGFAALGDSVAKSSCDFEASAASANPGLKLCWHLGGAPATILEGWRCGATEGLNSATNWEKLLFAL